MRYTASRQGAHLWSPLRKCACSSIGGALSAHLKEPEQARRDLAEAASLANGSDMAALRFMAVHNQGHVEYLLGNFPIALTLMERADSMDIEVDRAISRLNRARVMLEAGLVDEARDLLLTVMAQTGQIRKPA